MTGMIVLAPMEGVLDYYLRGILTALNTYDYCVSEFIRISDVIFPKRVFYREVPELKTAGRTSDGTPVWVQLLGSDPELMAANAKVAAEAGALGIDLNFGCPSRFVHRSNGGAAMLKEPQKLGQIVARVRDVVPANIPECCKIRLGWESAEEATSIFQNCIANGADTVVIHARTKKDGYLAGTVKWQAIAPLADSTDIPVIANGDIVDAVSAQQCRLLAHTEHLMVGRYAVAIPNLQRVISEQATKMDISAVAQTVLNFIARVEPDLNEHYQKARTKQFMGYIRLAYPELGEVFKEVCQQETMNAIKNILNRIANDSVEVSMDE